MRALVGEKVYTTLFGVTKSRQKRVTSKGPKHVSQPKQPLPVVDDPTRCRRCGAVLKYGTNGNGFCAETSCWGIIRTSAANGIRRKNERQLLMIILEFGQTISGIRSGKDKAGLAGR